MISRNSRCRHSDPLSSAKDSTSNGKRETVGRRGPAAETNRTYLQTEVSRQFHDQTSATNLSSTQACQSECPSKICPRDFEKLMARTSLSVTDDRSSSQQD